MRFESGTVVNYLQGIVNQASCYQGGDDGGGGLQVKSSLCVMQVQKSLKLTQFQPLLVFSKH